MHKLFWNAMFLLIFLTQYLLLCACVWQNCLLTISSKTEVWEGTKFWCRWGQRAHPAPAFTFSLGSGEAGIMAAGLIRSSKPEFLSRGTSRVLSHESVSLFSVYKEYRNMMALSCVIDTIVSRLFVENPDFWVKRFRRLIINIYLYIYLSFKFNLLSLAFSFNCVMANDK